MLSFNENKISENKYIRVFDKDIDPIDLKWHRDLEDRIILPLNKTDWMIQFDNELPIIISEQVFIPKLCWHRLIKGSNDLELELTKIICNE